MGAGTEYRSGFGISTVSFLDRRILNIPTYARRIESILFRAHFALYSVTGFLKVGKSTIAFIHRYIILIRYTKIYTPQSRRCAVDFI